MSPESLAAEGWTQVKPDGFSSLAGGFWIRRSDTPRCLGFIASEQHSNGHMGTVHGGMLLTFADIALGYAVAKSIGGAHCVTAQLQMHFVAAAKVGDFVQCQAEVLRTTSQLVFVRGLIKVGERTVASADGVWKILRPRYGCESEITSLRSQ